MKNVTPKRGKSKGRRVRIYVAGRPYVLDVRMGHYSWEGGTRWTRRTKEEKKRKRGKEQGQSEDGVHRLIGRAGQGARRTLGQWPTSKRVERVERVSLLLP